MYPFHACDAKNIDALLKLLFGEWPSGMMVKSEISRNLQASRARAMEVAGSRSLGPQVRWKQNDARITAEAAASNEGNA
jgi:hypothetical protein